MEREHLIPDPPGNILAHDKINFIRHFKTRNEVELKAYGKLKPKVVFKDIDVLYTNPTNFNSQRSAQFVKNYKPDIAFVFGPDIIKSPLLDFLPEQSINMHLGLSPWYKGSATLFWPFYFLEPQFAGVTFHKIVRKIDAGSILHQSIPSLSKGDGIHQVGVNAVLQAKNDLENLIDLIKNESAAYHAQKQTGKLFLTRDFKPVNLRVIYDVFNDQIVDDYLRGKLGQSKPRLIRAF